MNNIRDAILKAADHLERQPQDYRFFDGYIAGDGPGCLVAWACRYAGHKDGRVLPESSPIGFGHNDLWKFWKGLTDEQRRPMVSYTQNAAHGAALLRAYADARFPATESRPAVELGTWADLAGIWKPSQVRAS